MTKFEQLQNTITYLWKTYKLKIREMIDKKLQIYYSLHTNDKLHMEIKKLPKTIFYKEDKFDLKIKFIKSNCVRACYSLRSNNKHKCNAVLFLPKKLFVGERDFRYICLTTTNPTLERAAEALLDKLNESNTNLFTWK